MTRRGSGDALQAAALHGVALAILLWPLAGITYVPMVDLPGHLAITRVLDDFLHGKYQTTLQLNLDPVHKPAYVLLYALFAVLPKQAVGPAAAALLVASLYATVCLCLATLGRRPASSPLVVSLALLIAMFCFSSSFFWGLIPFLLSVPPALIAWVAYLQASGIAETPQRRIGRTLVFVAAALLAHVVHPLASLFLGIMVAGAAGAGVLLALVRRVATGASMRAALRSATVPLVVWAIAVAALHLLTAPPGHELDVARSAPAFVAPFHGPAAARAFLAQIPIELDVRPTSNRAAAHVSYPIAVAILLAAACGGALVLALAGTGPRSRGTIARLATVFVVSALVFLFLRHDLVRISLRALWFPVRGPGFLAFFFAILPAAIVLRALGSGRASRLAAGALAAAAFALAVDRSAVLRTHFVIFDEKVEAFFRGDLPDRYFRSQPFSYVDHIRVYNCYFDDTCYDLDRLFFAIYSDPTIYPISRRR